MSWFPNFRTERSGPDCSRPCSLRLGFLGQPFYYHTRPFWQARAFTNSAPIPPQAGPENFQCRGRVHSVAKSYGSQDACLRSESNPFLTHGTVESPCKMSLSCTVKCWREPPPPISPQGSMSNPFTGWRQLSKSFLLGCQLREHSSGVIIRFSVHHVPGGFSQLARQCLGRNHLSGFGRLAIVPAPAVLAVTPREVGRFDKSPTQIFVATLLVVFGLTLAVA